MQIQQQVPLAPLTTFQVGGAARFFAAAETAEDVAQAVHFAREKSLYLFVLGGGSNLLVADSGFPGMVLRIAIRGITERESSGRRIFESGAGEDWDSFVAFTITRGCAGIETLSGIPGTVGGTPVQNVGAYGQEVSETILSVRVLDLETMQATDLTAADCGFSYRSSIFNSSAKGRYIVLKVSFALTPGGKPKLHYADLQKAFAGVAHEPTLLEVRNAVRQIRHSKGMLIVPGEDDCRSAGSFFKNPIVPQAQYESISATLPQAPPKYPAGEGMVKMPAAWLVEQAGFPKGYALGNAGISKRHTLALINRGGATAAEILRLKDAVQKGVRDKFGIELQPEPVLLGF